MESIVAFDRIKPLLISENHSVSEVRRHARKLAEKLTERIAPTIAKEKVLFVFVMRWAMLLYPSFAETFENASFTFVSGNFFTELDDKDYDTVIIVDTVVETGRTITDAKKLLAESGISAKRWLSTCVCANDSVKRIAEKNFDGFFCLVFMEDVRMTIDAGKYAVCGDGTQIR